MRVCGYWSVAECARRILRIYEMLAFFRKLIVELVLVSRSMRQGNMQVRKKWSRGLSIFLAAVTLFTAVPAASSQSAAPSTEVQTGTAETQRRPGRRSRRTDKRRPGRYSRRADSSRPGRRSRRTDSSRPGRRSRRTGRRRIRIYRESRYKAPVYRGSRCRMQMYRENRCQTQKEIR